MKQVIALPADGARLTGPAKVKLTKKQHERRAHILGPQRKNGVYELDGGQEILLKRGEVVGIEKLSKVNKAQFEEVGEGPTTAPEPGTGKGAVSQPKDPNEGAGSEGAGAQNSEGDGTDATGDDTVDGSGGDA